MPESWIWRDRSFLRHASFKRHHHPWGGARDPRDQNFGGAKKATRQVKKTMRTVKLATEGTAGRDAWFGIRWRRKMAKGQQSLESGATFTLGSFSHGALEDIGGMDVQQCFWLVFQQIFRETLI